MSNIKDHTTNLLTDSKPIWIRGLYMLLFLVISYLAAMVVCAIVVFQFLFQLLLKQPNTQLLHLGQSLSKYLYDIVRFITYNSETMPFPFKAWPKAAKMAETLESD